MSLERELEARSESPRRRLRSWPLLGAITALLISLVLLGMASHALARAVSQKRHAAGAYHQTLSEANALRDLVDGRQAGSVEREGARAELDQLLAGYASAEQIDLELGQYQGVADELGVYLLDIDAFKQRDGTQ